MVLGYNHQYSQEIEHDVLSFTRQIFLSKSQIDNPYFYMSQSAVENATVPLIP